MMWIILRDVNMEEDFVVVSLGYRKRGWIYSDYGSLGNALNHGSRKTRVKNRE
jgi:hypothetical protein